MATQKIAYAADATITATLASLASSSTFVAGMEVTAINNTSNLYDDALVSGKITVGTTPTINTAIYIYLFSAIDQGPTYPDVMDGTDSVETLTSVGVGAGFLRIGAILNVDSTTSDRVYPFAFTVADKFGGVLPPYWSLFITHSTGVNLNATGGNHVIKYAGITYTVA